MVCSLLRSRVIDSQVSRGREISCYCASKCLCDLGGENLEVDVERAPARLADHVHEAVVR